MIKMYLPIACVALLCGKALYAGSFQLNLQGIRQTAMGGSGVALPWDASTLFFNPGGLARLDGIQAYGSINFVSPHIRYIQTPTGGYAAETQPHTSTPFAIYVGGPVKKNSKLALGIGVYTPFGSSANWGEQWVGKYIVQSISLSSIFFQPTVSYALNDKIALGAGLVYSTGQVAVNKAIPIQDLNGDDGQAALKGRATGFGYNLGVQVKATEKLHLGVNYRSGVNMEVKNGTAQFTVPSSVSDQFPNTTFTSTLPLPNILTIGAAYKISNTFTIQADMIYAGWKSYDSLGFDFAENRAVQDTKDPRSYKNTLAIRLGGHYAFSEKIELMAGTAYDPTPTQSHLVSPDAVDANRFSLSCGAVVKPTKKWQVMAALNYTTTAKRTVSYTPANMEGAYQIKSLLPAIGLSYCF